jgi:hypothetical protein
MRKENPPSGLEAEHRELLESERRRVELLLSEYLTDIEAADVADQLLEWAVELDDIAWQITADPMIKKEFSYDGVIFKYKDPGRAGVFVSRDGLRFLGALEQNNLKGFFENRSPQEGNKMMLEWIKRRFLEIPKIRLENLEKNGSISLIDKETIGKIVKSIREKKTAASGAEEPPPLPKDRFWEFYGREMEEYYRNRGEEK